MTAISFPNNPSSGVTHTAGNGIVYTYDGEKWTSIGTNSAGTWTRSGTEVSLTNTGDDLNVDSGTLFVDASTDSVGIGTTSPAEAFTLGAGNAQITSGQLTVGVTATSGLQFINDGTFGTLNSIPLILRTASSERMRIDDSSGTILFGATSTSAPSFFFSPDSGGGVFVKDANSTDTRTAFIFRILGTQVGSITTSGSATAYNTSSDYRLKENVVDIADGITRVKQLQPKRFNFIADDDTTVDGFLAHEAAEVVPECVTGEKDEVNDDGTPAYQGIDQSKLVPLLTAALQEAITKIETLEQRLSDAGIA